MITHVFGREYPYVECIWLKSLSENSVKFILTSKVTHVNGKICRYALAERRLMSTFYVISSGLKILCVTFWCFQVLKVIIMKICTSVLWPKRIWHVIMPPTNLNAVMFSVVLTGMSIHIWRLAGMYAKSSVTAQYRGAITIYYFESH